MNLRTCTVREVQRRPWRMLLTLLGITLGLATIVATRLTAHTVSGAYHELFDNITGGISLEVTAPGMSAFAAGWAESLNTIAGVKEVVPRIRGAASVVGMSGGLTTKVIGVDPAHADDWKLRQGLSGHPAPFARPGDGLTALSGHPAPFARPGDGLTGENAALIDQSLADSLSLSPGQTCRIWTPSGLASLRLAGTVETQVSTAGGLLVVSLDTARRLFNVPAQRINCLQVRLLEEGNSGIAGGHHPDLEQIRAEVMQRLPPGLTVHAPGGRGSLARSTLMAAEQGLSALGVMALITAAFVIFNTFLLNLSERRKQLALLKTLGATRWQVLRLLLGEALLLGVGGTLAGCALGTGLSMLLLAVMERFLGVKLPRVSLAPGPFLLAAVLGPGTPLCAAFLPAWKASSRPPLDWLLPQRCECEVSCMGVGLVGLLLLVLGLCPAVALCLGWFSAKASQTMLPLTLAVLLAGSSLAFPLLLRPLMGLLRLLPLGLVGRLALEALARQKIRTGLTAGVLFLALTVTVGFGQTLHGILLDLHDWYRQTVVADYLVRASMPDTSFSMVTAMPEKLGSELADVAGVSVVEKISFLSAEANGQDALVLARTFSAGSPIPMDLREGNPDQVRQGLQRGEAVLGTGLAEQLGLHRGDSFTLTTAKGPQEIRIAGTATEFAVGGAALYLEWDTAAKFLDVPGAHVLLVSCRPGATEEVGAVLKQFCADHHLLLQSNREARDVIDGLLQRVTGAIWALLALIFVVASLGIVNTLQMNIQDQIRTFGVLRALGMKSAQVRNLVLGQALMLGGLTLVPGALAGALLAWLISRGSSTLAGAPITFRLDFVVLAGSCAIALASAVLAALPPARRAVRLSVLGALH